MDSTTLACCLFISFFPGFALFWSIHEFTREQARVFMPNCTIVESIPQEYGFGMVFDDCKLHVFFGLDHFWNGICCIRSSKITRIID
jgi:hypothetical protein